MQTIFLPATSVFHACARGECTSCSRLKIVVQASSRCIHVLCIWKVVQTRTKKKEALWIQGGFELCQNSLSRFDIAEEQRIVW